MAGLSSDGLAGIVGLFGALTRAELERAVAELAYRRAGSDEDRPSPGADIDAALEEYVLVEHDGRLVVGPAAFPSLPDGAEDLPHIMDVPSRSVDRTVIAEAIVDEVIEDLDRSDPEAMARARELAYDLETWADVDGRRLRELLEH